MQKWISYREKILIMFIYLKSLGLMIFSADFPKALKTIRYFKNPWTAFKFRNGRFKKGVPISLRPKNGELFSVARRGDFWLVDKVTNGEPVLVEHDDTFDLGYVEQNGILLRQGTSDTFIYKEIFLDEIYKEYTLQLSDTSVVIDVGAHIGLFSLYCSTQCFKVYAYEATLGNYELAQKNIERTNSDNVKIEYLALWSKSGEKLHMKADISQQTGEFQVDVGEVQLGSESSDEVQSISIEDVFSANKIMHCDLLKMDIEGAEYAVLLSATKETLRKIGAMCLEYHRDIEGKHSEDDLLSLLSENNFNLNLQKLSPETGLIFANR